MSENSQLRVLDKRSLTSVIESQDTIELRTLIRTGWRRKWLILTAVILATALAGLYTTQLVPRYAAETLIMIESRVAKIVNFNSVMGEIAMDNETINTQIEVLRSRQLARKVIDALRLDRDPEFNPSLRSDPKLGFLATPSVAADGAELSEEQDPGAKRVSVLDAFLRRLDVSTKERSHVISVAFTSEDPHTAAHVSNKLADLYILDQREVKFNATRQATKWLNKRVKSLRKKVEASERAVEQFQQRYGLVDDNEAIPAQIAQLNTELIRASTARAGIASRLHEVTRMINSPGDIVAAADVLQSPIMQQLRRQLVEIEFRRKQLTRRYKVDHPDRDDLDIEIDDIQAAMSEEIKKIGKGLETGLSLAKAREASLREHREALRQRAAEANTAAVSLRALERDAEANRTLLKAFLARFKETSTQDDILLHQANARVISLADAPTAPEPSGKLAIIAVVFIGSTFLSMLLAFFFESRKTSFDSRGQVEEATGVPVLGLVPMLHASSTPNSYVIRKPQSAFAESIRGLYTNLLVFQVGAPPKKVLFVSNQRKAGNTTAAVGLAQIQAMTGKRVILIDTDLRTPDIHRVFGMPKSPGLVELVTGTASAKDVIREDEASGVSVIPAGAVMLNPPDILASESMRRLLEELCKVYDLIVLDSATLIPSFDALVLPGKVDATVFIVPWADAKREIVNRTIRQIGAAGGSFVGLLLTMVHAKEINADLY